MWSRLAMFTLALTVPLVACGGDDGVGFSGDPLTEEEAEAMAQIVMSQGLSASEDAFAAAAPAAVAASIPIDESVEVEAECPLGGSFGVSGSVEGDVDLELENVDVTYSFVHTHSSCGVPHEGTGIEFTLDGDPNITHSYDLTVVDGTSAELSGTVGGAVDWATDDGRSGSCPIDIGIDVSGFSLTETQTGSVSVAVDGVVCGAEISRSVNVDSTA